MLGQLCWILGTQGLRDLDDPSCLHPPCAHHHCLSGREDRSNCKLVMDDLRRFLFTHRHWTCPLPAQVRIFMEIHNNLYLKSERRLSPASLLKSSRDIQRTGGAASRGTCSLSLHAPPFLFDSNGSHTSFESGFSHQHLPMGPLRSNSITSHCDTHTHTTLYPGKPRQTIFVIMHLPICIFHSIK